MKKQQKRILELIEKMEKNTFLMPDNWMIEEVHMTTRDMSYKTYVGRRGIERYIVFEIRYGDDSVELNVRGNDVVMNHSIFKKRISIDTVLVFIEDIYKEQHSFIENAEGVKKIRAEIRDKKRSIEQDKKEIVRLKKQVSDALILKG